MNNHRTKAMVVDLLATAPNRAAATAWYRALDPDHPWHRELHAAAPIDASASRGRRAAAPLAVVEAAAADDPELLDTLARHTSVRVRRAVAHNPNIDTRTAERLSVWAIRQAEPDALESLLAAMPWDRVVAVADDENDRVLTDKHLGVAAARGAAPAAPREVFRGDADRDLPAALAPGRLWHYASDRLRPDVVGDVARRVVDGGDPGVAPAAALEHLLARRVKQETLTSAEADAAAALTGGHDGAQRLRHWFDRRDRSSPPLLDDDDAVRLLATGDRAHAALVLALGGFTTLTPSRPGGVPDTADPQAAIRAANIVVAALASAEEELRDAAARERLLSRRGYSHESGGETMAVERSHESAVRVILSGVVEAGMEDTNAAQMVMSTAAHTARLDAVEVDDHTSAKIASQLRELSGPASIRLWLSGRSPLIRTTRGAVVRWLAADAPGLPRVEHEPDDDPREQRRVRLLALFTRRGWDSDGGGEVFASPWGPDIVDVLDSGVHEIRPTEGLASAINEVISAEIGDDDAAWENVGALWPSWSGNIRELARTAASMAGRDEPQPAAA